MALPPRLSAALLCVAAALIAGPADARQESCRAPAPSVSREPNIFTEAQEVDLGDAVADHEYRQVRFIDDSTLTARLKEIGTRLLWHLPPSSFEFDFLLIDSPEAEAFVLPGGRIFVSRKLVAFARNEDELAGVLAHEIGHLVARHHSVVVTRWFREALDVTSVTDRRDIFEKYNRLQNNLHRIKPDAKGLHSNDGQIEADRLGVFLAAAAGYDPDALASFLERLTEASPDDGGFFSDLFGRTSPDVRRLRALVAAQAALMKSCAVAKRPGSSDGFGQWQQAVVAYTGLNRAESLGTVISRATLKPPIRGDLSELRFSPDGRLIVAQDNAGIVVLTRDPLRVAFSLNIPGARRPRFSPDSSRLTVHTDDLRVLTWQAETGQLESAHEIVVPLPCAGTELSPDGRVLACFALNYELSLYDVATNTRLFEKKRFPTPRVVHSSFGFFLRALRRTGLSMAFSPDSRYFAAAYHEEGEFGNRIPDVDEAVIYDLTAKAPLAISGSLRRLMSGGVSFLGDNRLLALNFREPAKSAVVALPAGDVQDTVPLVRGDIEAVSHGLFAVLRPFQTFAAAVLDLAQGRIAKASANAAIDRYDDVLVAERGTGEVALYAAAGGNTPIAAVTLPPTDLEDLTGLAVSPDLRRLAISTPARGAIWDLAGGRGEAMMPPFTGSVFADDGRMYADFLPWNGQPRQIAGVDLRASRIDRVGLIDVSRAFYTAQVGAGVVTVRPANGSRYDTNVVVEMRDAVSLAEPRWTKTYQGLAPRIATDPRGRSLLLSWPTDMVNGRERLASAPDVLERFEAVKNIPGNHLVEVYDVATGAAQGTLLVALGHPTTGIGRASVAGDCAVIADTRNRIHVYSLSTGEVKGQLFGRDPAIAPQGDVMAVENGPGRLIIYDLATMGVRAELQFRRGVTLAAFNEMSTELLVVTADQTVTRVAVPKPGRDQIAE